MPADPNRVRDVFLAASELPPERQPDYLAQACGVDADLRAEVEHLLAADADPDSILESFPRHIPSGSDTFVPSASVEASAAGPDATTHRLAESPLVDEDTGPGLTGVAPSKRSTADHVPDPLTLPSGGAATAHRFSEPAVRRVIAGRYTLVEVIGEGGMGSVYRAEQTQPVKRQVALKLIKAGMDSRAVLARFNAERQALALMDHPNIARVYDGGTTDTGQPFFVMELVDGMSITHYCDDKRLSVRARLELFVLVCRAVQHAHQKGIIHRDLKPGNVLVTEVDGRPTPKVIDFGVAKATEQRLTDESLADTGAIVGTPMYMSPEQADPTTLDIDTRTDIYALGVILYELLVGSPPIDAKQFKRGAILEMLRMVREVDPPRPSTKLSTDDALPNIAANRLVEPAQLVRYLRGDLDWIVMKSLEKDRTRRYDSANGFAEDIQRHLAFEPVLAAPPSRSYRMRKFARKHRRPVAAALILAVALLGAVAGSAYGVLEARNSKVANSLREEAEEARDGEARQRGDAEAARKSAETALVGEAREHANAETARKAAENAHAELARERTKSAWSEYGRAIQTAHQEWNANHVPKALSLLNWTRQDIRGWEWNYLHQLCNNELNAFRGHTGIVYSSAISPDGRRLATGSADNTARLWDTGSGGELAVLKGHTDSVYSLAFSPDGKRLVTASRDGTARIWDVATGALQGLVRHAGWVTSAEFSSDSKRVLTAGSDRAARVWDAESGNQIAHMLNEQSLVTQARFSPDGKRVVTNGMNYRTAPEIHVRDAATGRILATLSGHFSREQATRINSAVFSGDGKWILTASSDATARIWDSVSGAETVILKGHTGEVNAAVFSPDGKRVATASVDSTARLWDAITGTELASCKGHTASVGSIAFSSDGTRVLTVSMETVVRDGPNDRVLTGGDGTARVWDAANGTEITTLKGHSMGIRSASFSPDGTQVITSSDDQTARLWGAKREDEPAVLVVDSSKVHWANLRQDGKQILVVDFSCRARSFDMSNGKAIRWFRDDGQTIPAVFSADGKRVVSAIATSSPQGWNAKVWDADTGKLLATLGAHPSAVTSAVFSRDGQLVLTALWDGTAQIWDLESKTTIARFAGHNSPLRSAAFSQDGKRVVTASNDRTARIWDVASRTELFTLRGHSGPVNSAVFSGDGKWVLTASEDQTARLWEANSGAELLTFKGHTGSVLSAVFNRDNKRVLTASADYTARVWEPTFGTELAVLKGHADAVVSAAFSPDEEQVVTASWDGTIRVWNSRPHFSRLSQCRDLVRHKPKDSAAHHLLAAALFRSGNSLGAIASCRDALRFDPKREQSRALITSCIHQMEQDKASRAKVLQVLGELVAEFPAVPSYAFDAAFQHLSAGTDALGLGKPEEALASCLQAQEFLDKFGTDLHNEPRTLDRLLLGRLQLADLLAKLGKEPESQSTYRKALQVAEAGIATNHTVGSTAERILDLYKRFEPRSALSHATLGRFRQVNGDFHGAVASYRESIRIDPKLSLPHTELSRILVSQTEQEKSEAGSRESLAILKNLASSFPAVAGYRSSSAKLHNDLGKLLDNLGKSTEAAVEYRERAVMLTRLAADSPGDPELRVQLAWTHYDLANSLRRVNSHAEALTEYRNAVQVLEVIVGQYPTEPKYRADLSSIHFSTGLLCMDTQRLPEAVTAFERAIAINSDAGFAHATLGRLFNEWADQLRPEPDYREALATLGELAGKFATVPQYPASLAKVRSRVGDILFDLGKQNEAFAEYRLARPLLEAEVARHPQISEYREALNKNYLRMGDPAETRTRAPNDGHIYQVAFSRDGSLFLAAGDMRHHSPVHVYSTRTGDLLQNLVPDEDCGWSGGRFCPDGSKLVSWGSSSPNLYVWDVAVGKLLLKLTGHQKPVESAEFSFDGRRIVSGGSDNTLRIWDASTGKLIQTLQGHEKPCAGRFTRDGKVIVSYSLDKTIRGWDAASGREIWKHAKLSETSYGCLSGQERCFSEDGSRVLTLGDDGGVRVWDAGTGQLLMRPARQSEAAGAVFLNGGNRLAAWGKDRRLRVWDLSDGNLTMELDLGADLLTQSDNVTVSGDGLLVMTGHGNRVVKLRELITGRVLKEFKLEAGSIARALVFSPDSRLAAFGSYRGWVYLWRLSPGSPEAASSRFISAKLRNDLGKLYDNLGKSAEAAAEYRERAALLTRIIADSPDEPDLLLQLVWTHNDLANALRRLNQHTEALYEYRKAVQVLKGLATRYPAEAKYRADLTGIHFNIGSFCMSISKLPEAEEEFRQVTALAPNDPWGHANLGIILGARGRHQEAVACYAEVVRLDPNRAKFRWEQAMTLRGAGDKQHAVEAAREAVRLGPKELMAHFELGLALQDGDDRDGAIACFRQAIAIDPKFAAAHANLGDALRKKGDQAGAIASCQRAIAIDPKYAPAHVTLGLTYLDQNQPSQAIESARTAIGLNPKLAAAHGLLGRALHRRGDLHGARAALTEAAGLDKVWAPALADLLPRPVAPPPRAVK